ncbi:hypothetical protein [Teredinibacter franksiae]|uniref:hypothetical protein n=1 Tax=Teredinibacter franksiae TaxID=2761453 RepID=UPI0016252D00|nr:hypothetical protein [Teredinibacter franksiae]
MKFFSVRITAVFVILWLLPGCDNNTARKIIDISEFEENRLYFYYWFDTAYIVFKPSTEYLLTEDNHLNKKSGVLDPPETLPRTQYPVKVFMLGKAGGHMVFPYRKWHHYQLPCANLSLFVTPYRHGTTITPAGFRCALSVDDFWIEHLVYDFNGRSRSTQSPDLYVPLHYQTNSKLVLGVGSPDI